MAKKIVLIFYMSYVEDTRIQVIRKLNYNLFFYIYNFYVQYTSQFYFYNLSSVKIYENNVWEMFIFPI